MIEEYYDVFDREEYRYIYSTITSNKWQFGHCSNKNDQYESRKKFWWMDLSNDSIFTNDFFTKIKNITNRDYKLTRVYANGQTYGLDGSWHQDVLPESDPEKYKNAYTFLYYANHSWDTRWGGETVISKDDKITTYLPHPNKAIGFPANLFHYAKSPSRECYDLRVTIAYKLIII